MVKFLDNVWNIDEYIFNVIGKNYNPTFDEYDNIRQQYADLADKWDYPLSETNYIVENGEGNYVMVKFPCGTYRWIEC